MKGRIGMFVNNDNIVIKSILWEGIRYDLYKDHTLIMTLSNNINSNLRLYESIISLKPKKIVIKNARDIEVLKVLIKKKFFLASLYQFYP